MIMRCAIFVLAGMLLLPGVVVAQSVPCNQSLRTVTSYASTVTTEATQLKMKAAEFGVIVVDLRRELTEANAIIAVLQKDVAARTEADVEEDGTN